MTSRARVLMAAAWQAHVFDDVLAQLNVPEPTDQQGVRPH